VTASRDIWVSLAKSMMRHFRILCAISQRDASDAAQGT
jgi:hypothetical protein